MSTLTLSQLQETADEKFGDFTIELPAPTREDPDRTEEVAFKFYLRASKEARKLLADGFNQLAEQSRLAAKIEAGEVESDQEVEAPTMVDVFKEAFKALAVKPNHFTKLEKAIGDDLILWATVMHSYADQYESQSGEAQPSES